MMNHESQQKVERIIERQMKGTKFASRAHERGLNPLYIANQLSAIVGELCEIGKDEDAIWVDRNYIKEKLRNIQSQIDNILG